ncbi:MAG: PAS domain S-box protein, partial [Verrucomicrobiota bacterium]
MFRLGDYLFGWNLNFDTLGFHEASGVANFHPARMSPMTALNFLLLGSALLLAGSSRLIRTFQFLTLSTVLFSWLGFSHFFFGGAPMPFYTAMAMHTAICFLLLGAGIFCTRTDGGLMGLLVSNSAGGLLARRLLLPVLLLPFAITWFESWINHSGWFSPGAESALFTLDDIIAFGAIVWFNAALLHRADMKRGRAEESRAQLVGIVESSDDAIIGKTLEGVITSWNRGAEKIFGYSAQEAIGRPMLMLFPPQRVNEERDILERIARGENVENFETVRIRKDKKQIHVSATISPLKDSSGKIIGASKIAHDITGRKQAETSLSLFRSLIDQSSDGIEIIDPETGRFLDVNETTCQRLGYKREELLSMNVPDIEAVAVDSSSWRKVAEEIRHDGFKIIEGRHKRKDGSTFPVEVSVRCIKLDRDYLIAAVRDITERKQAEEAQRASEARYRILFEYAPDGIVIVDSKGYYLDVNASICRMLGYTRDEFIGLNATDIVAPAEIPHIGQALDVINTKSDYHREWQFRRKDGSVFAVDTIAAAMPDGNLLAMIRDITERKRAERRLFTQNAISRVLADSNTLNEVTPKIIQAICESEGWDFGAIWEADNKSNVLRCLEIWQRPELPAEELSAKTREMTFTLNTGLPGRVWASGKPLLISDIANDDNYPRAPFAAKIGLNSAVAFPIIVEGEVIGVIDFL